jgi:hypothetical protein
LGYRARFGFVALAAAAVVAFVACGDDDGGGTEVDEPGDSGPPPVRADAKTSGPDAADTNELSTMRLAHLAAESGPIDFCYQEAHAGTFVGPVLGGPKLADAGGDADADADAAMPQLASLAFGAVTKYLVLQSSGPLTIAIVEGGATSCARPIATGDVTLDPGKLSTIAVFSRPRDGGVPALEVTSFTDDRTTAADSVRVRVIHAALGTSYAPPEGPLAARASAAKTTVLGDRIEPRHASAESEAVKVDALGYVTAAPIPPPAAIAIGPAPTDGGADAGFEPWLSKPYDLGLTGGSLHTAFILHASAALMPDASAPRKGAFRVLWCADTTTEGDRTTCAWLH